MDPVSPEITAQTPHRAKRYRRALQVVAVLGFALLAWQVAALLLRTSRYPQPPTVPLENSDPIVARKIRETTESVRQAPYSPIRWGMLGLVLKAQDYPAAARECFEQARKLDPTEPMWPYYVAYSLASSEPQTAIPYLRDAVDLSGPGNHSSALLLAELLLEQGNVDEAETLFAKVLQERPADPRVQLGLGRVAFDRGDFVEARRFFEQVVQKAPAYKGGYVRLASTYQRLGLKDLTAEATARANDLSENMMWPDPYIDQLNAMKVGIAADIDRIAALAAEGSLERALELSERLVKLYPDNATAWTTLGANYLSLNRPQDAEKALRSSLAIAPDRPDTMVLLATALRPLGQRREAEALAGKACQLAPSDPNAYYQLALAIAEQGRIPESVPVFQKVVELRPSDLPSQMSLAEALAASGRLDEAKVVARTIQQTDPQNPIAVRILEAQAPPPPATRPAPAAEPAAPSLSADPNTY